MTDPAGRRCLRPFAARLARRVAEKFPGLCDVMTDAWWTAQGFILKPGASATVSSVVHIPPSTSRRSRTTTRRPAFAR